MKSQSSLVNEINLRPSEIAFYRENGYLTIPGFIPAELVQNLREEVLDMLAENGISRDLLSNASTAADKLRACSNYYKSSWLDKMINSENTLKLASSLIGGKACRYYPFSAVKAGGGGGQFHMHQDNNYTKHEPAEGSINIWVALVDMTPENGCLLIIPGSNKLGTVNAVNAGDGDSHRKVETLPSDPLPVRMRAGDAIAFSRLLIHGSGPNSTHDPRVAYALQYHREDVNYFDIETQSYKSLLSGPVWKTAPLDPNEKTLSQVG